MRFAARFYCPLQPFNHPRISFLCTNICTFIPRWNAVCLCHVHKRAEKCDVCFNPSPRSSGLAGPDPDVERVHASRSALTAGLHAGFISYRILFFLYCRLPGSWSVKRSKRIQIFWFLCYFKSMWWISIDNKKLLAIS